ncbi:MAG: DUF5050 domain-containing protein [Clostridia bacterium]|nr:DUF5050 domain-containing protein [Clostridia bacterium]
MKFFICIYPKFGIMVDIKTADERHIFMNRPLFRKLFCMIACLVLIVQSGCFDSRNSIEEHGYIENQSINDGVNNGVYNRGLASFYNGWIYYINSYNGELFRMREDGSEKVKLCDGPCNGVCLEGDWIYFTDWKGRIVKVKLDGSNKTVLDEESWDSMYVSNGWVYCGIKIYKDIFNQNYCLYRMRTDGSSKTFLNNDYPTIFVSAGEWLYFMESEKGRSAGYDIYRMKKDGSSREKVIEQVGSFVIVDGYIYYTNCFDQGKVYKRDLDSSKIEKVCNDRSTILNYCNGWIYYANENENGSLFKVKLSGENRERLTYKNVREACIAGDSVYCSIKYEVFETVRIRNNGTQEEILE